MPQYLALFRNRTFLLFWLAGAISNIGDFFNSVALVKILSEDPEHLGMMLAVIMIAKVVPGILLGPVAGVVADRFSRKTIMVMVDIIRAALVLGLVFAESPYVIMTLVFLSASAAAFFNPAHGALLPNLIEKSQLVTAGSLQVMTQRTAQLLGNGIGAAVLIAVGAHNVFIIDSISFVISALLLLAMVLPETAAGPVPSPVPSPGDGPLSGGVLAKFRSDLAEAMTFLKESPPVRHLITGIGIASVADSGMSVLLVTFFTAGLGLAAENLGFVWAGFGATSVVGALVIGAEGKRVNWRHLLTLGGGYIYGAFMGALIARDMVWSMMFLGLVGLGSGAVNVGLQAAVGELVPDHVRGRIFSAWGMVQNFIYVVGTLAAGALSDVVGPVATLMSFSTFYLLTGVYSYFAFRGNRSREAAPAPASVTD